MAMFRKPPLQLPKPKLSPPKLYPSDSSLTTSGVFKALESTRYKMKIGSVAAGIVIVFTITGGIWESISVVQAQVDAGTARINERVTLVRDDLAQHKQEEASRHERQEAKTDRLEQKMDVVLDALRVPMDRRPERAHVDGGQ